MLTALTNIDGITVILFLVEHVAGLRWECRWRLKGAFSSEYRVWRSFTSDEAFGKFVAESRDANVEIEWRSADQSTWSKVALLELHRGKAAFRVEAIHQFDAPEGFMAVAPVRGHGVGGWCFPATKLASGEVKEIEAEADCAVIANVLLQAGEFEPAINGLLITNLGASFESYSVKRHHGDFRLGCNQEAVTRRLWAVGKESVDPSLILKS